MAVAFTVDRPNPTALRALNYSPSVEAFKRKAVDNRSDPLGRLLTSMGPAYGSVFTRIDCEAEYGVELLSQSDMFSAEPQGRMIRRDAMPNADDHLIKKWQVLIAAAGTLGESEIYGRSIIADGRLEGKYVGPHAMVLSFANPGDELNLYAYAFLCTAVGISAVRAASYGTKVLGVRSDLLRNLPIPYATESTTKRVADLVRKCVKSREAYVAEMKLARSVIESLSEYSEALAMCRERLARTLAWQGELATLSAWNYASTGGALEYLQRHWSGRLQDAIEPAGLFNGLRFARVPCSAPHGLDFLSQRDVFLIRPVGRRIKHPGIDDGMLFIPAHAILLASHGQLTDGSLFGRAESARCYGANRAFTQDILRIIPKPLYSEALLAFLCTRLGLLLLRSTAVGTSVPTMHIGLLRRLPIPELTKTALEAVRTHISAAISARLNGNAAEAEAVRIVEEEVLPKWLN